jgi:hypothetical protein
MSWFDSILKITKDVGKWMETNSTAASILSGAVVGGAQYYADKQRIEAQEDHEEKMYERRKSDVLDNSKASSGIDVSGYGNYAVSLTGGTGLLTNGKLAKK